MNKIDFIPYEQALILEESGFDERCSGYYVGKELITSIDDIIDTNETSIIPAPTFSQAFRWFREKHQLYHFFGLDLRNVTRMDDIRTIQLKAIVFTRKVDGYNAGVYETYEEAELGCLKKLIEFLQ